MTGARVSALGFGCGSVFLRGYPAVDNGVECLEKAFEAGVNYFDTAQVYGSGESERRLGLFLKGRRDEVFVATKIGVCDGSQFMSRFEQSLNRLQTDRVDLLHIHGLATHEEVAQIGVKDF